MQKDTKEERARKELLYKIQLEQDFREGSPLDKLKPTKDRVCILKVPKAVFANFVSEFLVNKDDKLWRANVELIPMSVCADFISNSLESVLVTFKVTDSDVYEVERLPDH